MKEKKGVTQDVDLTAEDLQELANQFKAEYKNKIGEDFPTDPKVQLMGAIQAVFRSWDNPRANVYRRDNDIPYSWGKNATYTWTAEQAAYFNEHILPTYDRESWGGRQAVAGEHKMGTNDLAFAYLENTKETAIDLAEAEAQPFYLQAAWVKDGDKVYYRPTRGTRDTEHYVNYKAHGGLNSMGKEPQPATRKYDDPDREQINNYYSGRDVPLFRLSEAYLMRANAYGLKGQWSQAIADINMVRERAAYKPGENRAEVIANMACFGVG